METTHKHPPYLMIWLYLAILTAAQLALLTAAAGFCLGAGSRVDLRLLLHTLVGTALVAAGTNAFNQLRERDIDARMQRTRRRPLPSGRVSPRAAGAFAGVISVVGVAYLGLAVNLLTAGLAALTLASYVLLYTPLRSEEHTAELQSQSNLVCRLLLEKKTYS